jgi:2-haloacid dehalogenase
MRAAMNPSPSIAVFDLGGVLIDWNPRHLYRKLFDGDDAAMERFLATVCTQAWNERQDAGRSFAEATEVLCVAHPDKRALIEAWGKRFDEMMAGPIHGTVEILAALRARGVPLYALSNWSAETYPLALRRFDFLQWFRGVLISGRERVIKPDTRIFRLLLERFAIAPASAVYIDDNPRNAAVATELGMHGLHFTGPETGPPALRRALADWGLLGA